MDEDERFEQTVYARTETLYNRALDELENGTSGPMLWLCARAIVELELLRNSIDDLNSNP